MAAQPTIRTTLVGRDKQRPVPLAAEIPLACARSVRAAINLVVLQRQILFLTRASELRSLSYWCKPHQLNSSPHVLLPFKDPQPPDHPVQQDAGGRLHFYDGSHLQRHRRDAGPLDDAPLGVVSSLQRVRAYVGHGVDASHRPLVQACGGVWRVCW